MGSRSEPYEAPAIQAFASELAAWRSVPGLNQTELAETLGYTPQWISQLESAKSIPSKEFAENVDTYFKTNGVFTRQWQRIIETRHLSILPPGFAEYVERETETTQIRSFEISMIIGLLQTENYMRAVISHNQNPDTAESLVTKRLKRQEILSRKDAPNAWFTLDEAALRRVVAAPEIMHEQMVHILTLEERPNISIDVIPQCTQYYPGLTGGFTILSFTDAPDAVYGEIAGQGMLIQDPRIVAGFGVRYNSLRGYALRVAESRALITRVME